ncbi:MAG: GNAT family N-acetyltransferase [Eubacterium sp.]|uniref:GNAT family N-acetyltransferase n=1 Tax=Eubacterium sp. TaxID=142586 RepID=UPI0039920C11
MIKLAQENDFVQLANMRWEHNKEDDITYDEDNISGIDKDEFIKEYVNFLKTESKYKIFIMKNDEKIVAAMYVMMVRKVPKPKKRESYIAYLTNVHTLKNYRNQGIGTEMLSYIKNYLKQNRCESVILWPSEKSVDWYVRNGFKLENEILECELWD